MRVFGVAVGVVALLAVAAPIAHAGNRAQAKRFAAAAQRHEDAGRVEDALPWWEKARAADSTYKLATYGLVRVDIALGRARLKAGDARDAMRLAAAAVTLTEDDPDARTLLIDARLLLAQASYRADESRAAEAVVDSLLGLVPKHPEALLLKGRLAYDQGHLDLALRWIEASLAAAPNRASARKLLAKVRREIKVESRLEVLHTAHFRISFAPDAADRVLAEEVGRYLEVAYAEVGASLGYFPHGEGAALLYPERDFAEVTGAHGWVAALFDGKIRVPMTTRTRGGGQPLRDTIVHEYVHACVSSMAPRCPVWLHEGLAQHFEGKRPKLPLLRKVAAAGKLPSFEKLRGSFTTIENPALVNLVYMQSLAFTQFLIGLRGPSELHSVLESLGRGLSLDAALERSFGETLGSLESRWKATLR